MVTTQHPGGQSQQDPTNELRIENEILKLKMQAEHGAHIFTDENLPPELEAEFLHQIQTFEQAWKEARMVKIRELLGNPTLPPESGLDDASIETELERITSLMQDHQIFLDIPQHNDRRSTYKYICEQLLDEEVDDLKIEGLVRHFYLGHV